MQSTPVFLCEEFHGQRGLVGYSLWCRKQSDMTGQRTHTYITSLRLNIRNFKKCTFTDSQMYIHIKSVSPSFSEVLESLSSMHLCLVLVLNFLIHVETSLQSFISEVNSVLVRQQDTLIYFVLSQYPINGSMNVDRNFEDHAPCQNWNDK